MSEQTEIVEFKQSEAALAVLRVKYKAVPDFTTKDGYEEGRQGIAELRTLRTSLDKARLKLNADDQARIKYRNSEAKRITGELVTLEDPLKAAKLEIDQAEERKQEEIRKAEEKRIAAIEFRMKELGIGMACHAGMSSFLLEGCLDALGDCFSGFDWQEFAEAADSERIRVKEHILAVIEERKKFDAEQAELEKMREEMRLQKEELAKEQERQRVISQEAEAKVKAAEEALAKEKRKAEDLLKAKEEEEARQERIKEAAANVEKIRLQVEAEAARREARKPEVEKLRDWVLQLRFIDAPAAVKDPDLLSIFREVSDALDDLVTETCDKLEEL